MIRGAIFDVDGTLLDSMWVWEDALTEYLESKGVNVPADLKEQLWENSVEESCKFIHEHFGLKETPAEIRTGFLELGAAYYREQVKPKPGVPEFLEEMRRRGIAMTVASSGDRSLIEAAFANNGLTDYFDMIFTCDELGTNKRTSLIYWACTGFMGLESPQVAVFEDVLHAVTTAKNEGFMTIGVEDLASAHHKEQIMERCDYYMKDMTDIEGFWAFADGLSIPQSDMSH